MSNPSILWNLVNDIWWKERSAAMWLSGRLLGDRVEPDSDRGRTAEKRALEAWNGVFVMPD